MKATLFLVSVMAAAAPAEGRQNPVREVQADWNWGELIYGRTYTGNLTITNECATEQRVLIISDEVPDLIVRPVVALPPGKAVQVPYHVTPKPRHGQKLSEIVKGEVIIWHPGDARSNCPTFKLIRTVSARVRTITFQDVEQEATTVNSAAVGAACALWWIRGENPAPAISRSNLPEVARRAVTSLDANRCRDLIRPRARQLRRLLEKDMAQNAAAWSWLPREAAIDRLSLDELIAFRRRAVELRDKAR